SRSSEEVNRTLGQRTCARNMTDIPRMLAYNVSRTGPRKERTVQRVQCSSGNPVTYFSGEIDMATADAVAATLDPWIAAGGAVPVDLSGVTFIDSSGLSALVRAADALGERGCILIHGVDGPVARTLEISGLEQGWKNVHVIGCSVLAGSGSSHSVGSR